MFREKPLNYFITLVVVFTIWFITALTIVPWLGDNMSLNELPIDQLLSYLKIIFLLGALFPVIFSFIWFYWGDKPSSASNPSGAKKLWFSFFFILIGISFALILAIFIYLNIKGETIGIRDYIILYLLLALQTFFAFWLSTFLFSPVNVKYIPLFKK